MVCRPIRMVTLLKMNLCFPHCSSYVYAKKCKRLEIISYIEFFISPPSHTVTHLGQCWCINGPDRLMHLFIYLIYIISIEWTPLIVASQISLSFSIFSEGTSDEGGGSCDMFSTRFNPNCSLRYVQLIKIQFNVCLKAYSALNRFD